MASISPPGASSTICVSGSTIGTMPVSSSTVETQIELEPDMGGVSSGSMMIQAATARGVLRRHQQVHMAEDAAAWLLQHEVAQGVVGAR